MNATKYKKITPNLINWIIFLLGSIIRFIYVAITDISIRQHDLGNITSLSDDIVNPGHLGYIEYIAKFHKLPDFDPFSIFSYYHPPIHHVLLALVVDAFHNAGFSDEIAFKAAQFLVCVFSCITLYIILKIFMLISNNEKYICIPFALTAFHPGLIYMSGTMNNDMLATLFMVLSFYLTLLWIKKPTLSRLLLIALSIGIGMEVKINVAVVAVPIGIVMLLYFIREAFSNRALQCIKSYSLFALIVIPLSLLWSIRNYVRFSVTPGIASATPQDFKYIGDIAISKRICIPDSLGLSYPFHSPQATYSNNCWLIAFRTSLFAENWPDLTPFECTLASITFVLSLILGIATAIVLIYVTINMISHSEKKLGTLLLSGYLTVIFSYILFVLKYPYTCSCDFRYIPLTLILCAVTLTRLPDGPVSHIINRILSVLILAFLMLAVPVMFITCIN